MTKPTTIHIIADYGVGDPSFGEVMQKLQCLSPGITCIPTSVPAFSTIATGFWTVQYALVNPIPNMMIFTNTAPRKDNKEKRVSNEGEGLVYALLTNGIRVVGVNSGFCFSFVKPYIKTLYHVNVANKGSQFRSRDFYPDAVVGIARKEKKWIGNVLSVDSIPNVPTSRIAWIDGYGNMKTTIRKSEVHMTPGQPVIITIDDMKRTAFFTDGSFSVREGELAFAPGSSGGDDRFMELFLRGLSAWVEFGKPHIETAFTVTLQ